MMDTQEAAQATQGETRGGVSVFTSVSSDTRTLAPGALFVALRGPRFDGHVFLEEAARRGARAALVDSRWARAGHLAPLPLVIVDDTRVSLGRLAAHWRYRHFVPAVAVTGSNGKTTVKEMIAACLRAHAGDASSVLATEGNLNNDIGVPLMLLRLRDTHRYAVFEMGMNHFGEIDYLTRLVRPQVALVNNAHAAHLAGVGSLEGVARAKGEIYGGLTPEGVAVINADDDFADYWRGLAGHHRVVSFGLDRPAEVTGSFAEEGEGMRVLLRLPSGNIETRLCVSGVHNVRNALAAAAAAHALGLPLDAIAQGLAAFRPVRGRLRFLRGLMGATFIDDTYNANPHSMRAAIDVLAARPGRRILVAGAMGELGSASLALHAEVGAYARSQGIDILFCLGEDSRAMASAFGRNAWHFERIEELLADLENLLSSETTVLVKGSRFMAMERVVKSFVEGA